MPESISAATRDAVLVLLRDMLTTATGSVPTTNGAHWVAGNFEAKLGEAIAKLEQNDPFGYPCAHNDLDVLDGLGAFEDDHETGNVRCQDCQRYFVATFWKIDRPTELRPMTPAEQARYTTVSA